MMSAQTQEEPMDAPTPGPSKNTKKNLYRWHRITGLIVLIPLILWTVSGLMHPMMAHWFKVQLKHDKIEVRFDSTLVKRSPQQVLQQNQIESFYNFRMIRIADSSYYQVKMLDKSIRYFSTASGSELKNGDMHYAHYLAKYFFGDTSSKIIHSQLLSEFDFNYQYVNRLLPVYRISFDDDRQTDIYVETFGSRLATYNDNARRAFLWVFNNFHTWSFLENISSNGFRFGLMILILTVILFAAVSGVVIYIWLWKKFNKQKRGKGRNLIRRYHRQLGIFTSLFMLMFAFSGAYHATTKLDLGKENSVSYQPVLKASSFKQSPLSSNLDWERLENLSAIVLKKDTLFQISYLETEDEDNETLYYSVLDGRPVENGDEKYASFLARKFASGKSSDLQMPECCVRPVDDIESAPLKITETEKITHFTREYGFVNKRLPVVKVAVNSNDNKRYFIETKHSLLAAQVTDADMREGYSFAFLHKFFFMEWAGKSIRDFTMAVSALAVLIVSLLGLATFLKK